MLSHARASRHAGQSRPRTSSRHPVAGIQPVVFRQTESQDHRDPDPLQGAHLRRDSDFPFSRRLAAVENGVVRPSQVEGDLERLVDQQSGRRASRRPLLRVRSGNLTRFRLAIEFSDISCVASSRHRSILVSLWSPISIRPYFGPEWNSRMPCWLVSIVAGNASA